MALPEDANRHEVYLARLASGLLKAKVYPSMEAAYKAARLILLDAGELGSQAKMIKVMNAAGKVISAEFGAGLAGLTDGLEDMAVYESAFSASLAASYSGLAISAPAVKQVKEFVRSSIMTLQQGQRAQAGTWAQYVQGAIDAQVAAVNAEIVAGYQQGRTVGQITRSIRNLYNGVLIRDAEALARTGQSHYANAAREAMAQANPLVKYRVYSATFDNRTTLGCRSLHGESWEISDDTYVRLPRHFNCRSTYLMVASLEDAKEGTQQAVGGKDADINPNRKLKYRGKRDKDIFKPGQIDGAANQDQWLREQPDWFIESSLGKTRAKLFKDGKMSIDKFTDMTGETINLDQLREMDAEAFKRAGL